MKGLNKYSVIKEFVDVDQIAKTVGSIIYATSDRGTKLIKNGLVTLLEEYTDKLVQTRYRGGNLELFNSLTGEIISTVDKNGIDDVEELKAAIMNLGSGEGADLTEVNTRLSALENPLTINSFTITNPTVAQEVGTTLSSVTFLWDIENYSGTGAKLQDVSANTKLVDVTSATKTHTQPVSVTKNTPGTQGYQLQITVGTKTINSTTRTINWYYPVFYGNSSKASGLTEAEIEAFTKNLKANASGSYSFGAVSNTYKWIFVHESFNPTSFKSGGFDVPMQSPINITIENDYGVSISLKGYRTTSATSGALDLVVS